MPKKIDRTGETAHNTKGRLMKIVEYNNHKDMVVEFVEDGERVSGVAYKDFKEGYVRHPKDKATAENRVGETATNTKGRLMKIVDYNSATDMVVEFEDGERVSGVSYTNFKKGNVRHPKDKVIAENRVGETATVSNGMTITIIAYHNAKNVDVQFEDGAIRKGVNYSNFKKGNVRHPKKTERIANRSKNRIGEIQKSYNGQIMMIIEYIDDSNIIVEFNDKCKTHVRTRYKYFKKGCVKNPNYYRDKYIGESTIATNGQTMKIVEYINSKNIVVEFNDKYKTHVKTTLSNYIKGKVKNPNYIPHVGETSITSNGMKMTIIAYRNSNDIDVQLENGETRNSIKYNEFLNGKIIQSQKGKGRASQISIKHIGETSTATNGQVMTVVAYRSGKDIDVQFRDGAVKKGVSYVNFKKGNVRHPKVLNRVGETAKAKNGMQMTIIAYRGAHDIDVRFEDGAIRERVQYAAFILGNINHPNELRTNFCNTRIGEVSVASNGMKMTIIDYRRYSDIDIQFEDGTVREGVCYGYFKKGNVRHPKDLNRVGETAKAKNGMQMTIIAYRGARDIDVRFEDGGVVTKKTYQMFIHGEIRSPHFPMVGKGQYKTFQTEYAYTTPSGEVYFYCECQNCGWKKNMKADEAINCNHVCEEKEAEIYAKKDR